MTQTMVKMIWLRWRRQAHDHEASI